MNHEMKPVKQLSPVRNAFETSKRLRNEAVIISLVSTPYTWRSISWDILTGLSPKKICEQRKDLRTKFCEQPNEAKCDERH